MVGRCSAVKVAKSLSCESGNASEDITIYLLFFKSIIILLFCPSFAYGCAEADLQAAKGSVCTIMAAYPVGA